MRDVGMLWGWVPVHCPPEVFCCRLGVPANYKRVLPRYNGAFQGLYVVGFSYLILSKLELI